MASEIIRLHIDRFGRVVLPKPIRDRLGIKTGTEFEVEEREDAILLKPVFEKATIIYKNGWPLVKLGKPVDRDIIQETIEKVREERNKQVVGPFK